MSKEAIAYYAAKYFPHLMPVHGEECIKAILRSRGINVK